MIDGLSQLGKKAVGRRGVVAVGAVAAVALASVVVLGLEDLSGSDGAFSAEHVFRGYLIGWLLILGVSLGAQAFLMIHHLTGGWWGFLIRRPAEAAGLTLPLIAILGIPLIFGASTVFPWANPARMASEALLKHRAVLFNPKQELIRGIAYFVIWSFVAFRLSSLSRKHDATGDPMILAKLRQISVIGLIVYFFTMSLASMDWICSREVDWYSTTFGVVTCLGQAVGGLCILILTIAALAKRQPMRDMMDIDALHDIGNLLLAAVVLWAYTSFAQFLVIWIGQTQDDSTWFFHRMTHDWQYVGVSLMLLHFLVPFVLLLQQPMKRNVGLLATIAAGVFFMRIVDYFYMIVPSSPGRDGEVVSLSDFLIPPILFAVWLITYLFLLSRRPLNTKARDMLVSAMAADDHHGHEGHTAGAHA